jgi:hypothetical protein
MPQRCHRCGADGDGTNFTPDASEGYTKLVCTRCCLMVLMQGGGGGGGGGVGGHGDSSYYDDDYDDYDEARGTSSPSRGAAPSASASNSGPGSSRAANRDSSSPPPPPPSSSSPSQTSFRVGSRVCVTGLVAAPQHNGKAGTVCGAVDTGTGRLTVALDDVGAKKLKIKACNLVAFPPVAASDSGRAAAGNPPAQGASSAAPTRKK